VNGQQVIDVIRKNSINPAAGIVPSAAAPGLGNVAEFGPGIPRASSPVSDLNPSPRPRPIPPGGRMYPSQHRYTLTDSGPSVGQMPGAGPGRPQSISPLPTGSRPSSRPPPGRAPSGPIQSSEPVAAPRTSKTGPTTFAEMGIQGAKADDKDCVIM